MNNIEKLERILTKELVEKNVDIIARVESIEIKEERITNNVFHKNITSIHYKFTLNEHGFYKPLLTLDLQTNIDLSKLSRVEDSNQEQDILAYIVYEHINSLENKINQEIDREDYENKYINEVKKKIEKQFDSKNKPKGEFGFKDGNLYVSGVDYINTPYKPEILVTPDGLETVVEDDEHKSSIVYKGKRTICKVEKKPAKKINLGSLTLQEKDGKLAVTDKNGLTRFI
ncbi:hypothetical protein [Mammaliicoccus sciuri]|uniref:hypothetical protein n=1 Tax=Mammaliicoccus sciuri TaxID=1296 RepID=UPI002DB87960|nr:hypothetical protein [Mammaliicoccus sciuri]MEB6232493.1 hypothetical protein [Mammaliicoccus sciuri]